MRSFNPGIHDPILGPDDALLTHITFFDDFTDGESHTKGNVSIASGQGKFSGLINMGQWMCTLVDSGGDTNATILCDDASPGGSVTLTTDDAALDSWVAQLNGEAFKLQAGKRTAMEVRIKLSTITGDWFVGLAATLVTAETNNTDFVGFGNTDADDDINFVTGKNAAAGEIADIADRAGYTATDTGSAWVAATYVTLRWEADGISTVAFYVDGDRKGQHTTDICDDVTLTPTIIIKANAATAAAQALTMDYIYVTQER